MIGVTSAIVFVIYSISACAADSPPIYHPAPLPYHPAPPVEAYGPPFNCPNYPYCNEAPYNLYHLQHEIEALRHRAALIVKHGENLQHQQPNQPFVQGL